MSLDPIDFESYYHPPSPEEQRERLADVQLRHHLLLSGSTIRAKLIENHGFDDSEPTTRLLVSQREYTDGSTGYCVAMSYIYEIGGKTLRVFRHLCVVQETAGKREKLDEFTEKEALLVTGLTTELNDLRKEGILPHLRQDLLDIDF